MSKYEDFVKRINNTPFKVVIATTGGGQSFTTEFTKFSGASKTIEDVHFPYGHKALDRFCGKEIAQSVNEEVARLMATRSYDLCVEAVEPRHAIGIGLTCSLATDNEREGRTHRIYAAIHSYAGTSTYYIHLDQGATREREEEVCRDLMFSLLLDATDRRTIEDWDVLHQYPETVKQIGGRSVDRSNFQPSFYKTGELVIAPGSYNPCHSGHIEMLEIAEEIFGIRPIVEITTINADKGTMDYLEVADRFKTVDAKYMKVVTSARTFLDKARWFTAPGRSIIFVVGADTWNRILDPKYAGPTRDLYNEFVPMNVRFLVFGRPGVEITYDWYMSNLMISDSRALNHSNPISSTAIREGRA